MFRPVHLLAAVVIASPVDLPAVSAEIKSVGVLRVGVRCDQSLALQAYALVLLVYFIICSALSTLSRHQKCRLYR